MDLMKSKQHAAYIKQYQDTLLEDFTQYAAFLEQVLRKAVKQYAPLSIVQTRPKSVPSFAEKIIRKGYTEPFVQMTDLCGARVITVTEAQTEALTAFIKENFDIDYANSLDVGKRLRKNEFGYRSLHYIVQCRPGNCLDVKVPKEILPRPDIPFKAEIQVRTVLQHGWSEVLHDRIYKNSIKVPALLEREGARLAALLEEGDWLISRVVRDIDSFVVDIGAHMPEEKIREELINLDLVLSNEKDPEAREKLALRMCKLLRAGNHWLSIETLLLSFIKKTTNAALLREYGNALCEKNKNAPRSTAYAKGQEALTSALALEPDCADTHAALARSYQRLARTATEAHDHFRKAYHLAPENPYHFAAYIEYELLHAPSSALISLIAPAIREAAAACSRHIEVGIELPRAYLTLGKLYLLLGDAYASVNAYAKGVRMVLDRKTGECEECLELELDSLARLENAKGGLEGDAWGIEGLKRVLLIGLYLANGDPGSLRELRKLKQHTYAKGSQVLMVAGGCDKAVETAMKIYEAIVRDTVADFDGVIVGGGTKSGISGVVGGLKTVPGRCFETVGYLPRSKAADRRYGTVVKSNMTDFTPLDAIQAWVDVIASGIKPDQVSVLGFNGGAISAVEYRLGLAFGASVGVMAGSGRAADDLLEDDDWRELAAPLGLLDDPMTLRAFINPGKDSIPEDKREALAKAIHITYCKGDTGTLNKRILKDNGLPWKDLPQTYKNANFAQADYIGEILKTEGLVLESVKGKADNSAFNFKEDACKAMVERMAEKEHGRWNVERLREGWRPGKRDDTKKIHDCLVPWEDLPDDIKDYDRDSVKSWPELLGKVGIKIQEKQ